ncbi:endo alpha-1,4 polygalactosaminidase [Thermus arciformis]|uniref:endo alpha-1,4 polygalactosaminidase n=1 Tax=Thermus arciformis TaxID=482827 RepID=UPI001F4A87E4|nr:endo alpha-1,4 polygalactosaminidase [Thermus arciformis]
MGFYYGQGRLEALRLYRRVVLQPWAYTPEELARLAPTEALAYLSLGEDPGPPAPWQLPRENPRWGTRLVDPGHPAWVARVVEEALRLLAQGFRGLFLDNLDQAASVSREATLALLLTLRRAVGPAYLLANRGFALLPQMADAVDGVVFEAFSTTWEGGPRPLPRPLLRANAQTALTLAGLSLERFSLDYADRPNLARFARKRALAHGLFPLVAKERHLLLPTDTEG